MFFWLLAGVTFVVVFSFILAEALSRFFIWLDGKDE